MQGTSPSLLDDDPTAPPSGQHATWRPPTRRRVPAFTRPYRQPSPPHRSSHASTCSSAQPSHTRQPKPTHPSVPSVSSVPSVPSVPSNPTRAANPSRQIFDPWNTSATGHQRAENRLGGSTDWRDSRNRKLESQYRGGLSGGERRLYDTVGAGSADFGKDGRKANGGWEKGAAGLRGAGQKSLLEVWGAKKGGGEKVGGKREGGNTLSIGASRTDRPRPTDGDVLDIDPEPTVDVDTSFSPQYPQIFTNLTFYLSGSTAPTISDHKLKHLLAIHGGSLSTTLRRRQVTHVILGQNRCGGGLAASKIQKEVPQIRGAGVKFVSAEWVVECVKKGKRVPERRFEGLKVAGRGSGMFVRKEKDVGGT
ncbi:hypothetical protein M011DRAFT_472002 [Sporormia fimetaria CBS 119925]|uniref:BRCT domain-containing protein n=1 Tax=Sporormia fimetaria CBS 119925 TaxID=1340428 RepID=A0A6A6UWN7_9PLEO|nr:hypothetical protein M011DRAFT_472002 [Sporormia fimetaria CBS 119925]